jgi:hypothetical protein
VLAEYQGLAPDLAPLQRGTMDTHAASETGSLVVVGPGLATAKATLSALPAEVGAMSLVMVQPCLAQFIGKP